MAGAAFGDAGTALGVSARPTLARRVVAEATGTALLLAAVVGSGIMGERLAAGNVAVALLANTLATGAALVALILTFRPISGAHLNPAVTLADAFSGGFGWWEVPLDMSPGVHRIAIRVDGGAWMPPPEVPTAADEFGGEVGLIVVE